MPFSLLAHLYPRIKGSQEDVATFSLGYILEQSAVLNEAFTALIADRLRIEPPGALSYRCQDADAEYGRPDIAAYQAGQLKMMIEAKFYAGLTPNQPSSYLKRLSACNGIGLVFICPRDRMVSLWDKLCALSREAGFENEEIAARVVDLGKVRMTILSWSEILAELIRTATSRAPEFLGDLKQLEGFCNLVDSEAFMPFRPDDLSIQTARNMDRYYQVVDETHRILSTHSELKPSTKGLRRAPRWQGYSQYIVMGDIGVSIDFLRKLWKNPASYETPFWCHFEEVQSGKWVLTSRINDYLSSLDAVMQDDFYGTTYIALPVKPFATLEETAEDLAEQILSMLRDIRGKHDA